LRGTLGLRTAALLWRADRQLYLREVSSECERLVSGPFELDRGLVAAAFTTEQVVWIPASKSAGRVPLYSIDQETGDLAVLPLFDGETPLGVLLLDALPDRTLDLSCLQTLEEAARFAQRAVENERLFLTV